MERKVATIRKWYGSWGIAHCFVSPTTPPQKFFIHTKNLSSPEAFLGLDVKITFIQGEPRSSRELPVALEIEVASVPTVATKGGRS